VLARCWKSASIDAMDRASGLELLSVIMRRRMKHLTFAVGLSWIVNFFGCLCLFEDDDKRTKYVPLIFYFNLLRLLLLFLLSFFLSFFIFFFFFFGECIVF